MKAKRLLWAVVALFATFSMTVALSSCDKDNEPSAGGNTEIPEGGDSTDDEDEPEEMPEISNPAADKTILLVNITNAKCDDFSLSLQGISGEWADGDDSTPDVNLLTRVPGTKTWFQIEVPAMDETQGNFKFRANESWTYEPKSGYEFLEDAATYVAEGSADGNDVSNPNNLHIIKAAGGKVIALKIVEMPTICDAKENYKVTLKTTYCDVEGSEYTVGIIGSIPGSSWGTIFPMEKIDDTTYTYTIEGGSAGMEFKFQSTEGNWANEPQQWKLDEKEGVEKWMGLDNYKLEDGKTDIDIDLSDAAKHPWKNCLSEDLPEE